MIAPFPLDDLTVLRCFPDQRAIDALTDPSALEHSQLLAAFQCGKLFNEERYWLFASVIQDPSFLDRGLSQLE